MKRHLRYGMVGGGPGAFIGDVHRMAAGLDGEMELVAGAFSSDPNDSRKMGQSLQLDPTRAYGSFEEMARAEAGRDEGDRIDFVSIVTPNHLHFEVAKTFLEGGFDVVCDKPLTTTLEDAETLCRLVSQYDAIFALTHNYTGYPMIKEARSLVREGRIGSVRRIQVEYAQGWLSTPLEETGHRQAGWRTDPAQAGIAGALGDIGTHAHNLARYVTGLEIEELLADLTTFVDGRRLEDDASLLSRWTGGARGTLTATQIASGEDNDLSIRIYGSEGSLAWTHETAERLRFSDGSGRAEILRRGHDTLSSDAQTASRLPAGHPEGFIEGFANIYRAVARAIAARAGGEVSESTDFPTVWDGARGVHFLERAIESSESRSWVDTRYTPPKESRS